MSPVVTSPSMRTSSTSASNPPVATRPQAANAGPPLASPPDERWKELPSRSSRSVIVRVPPRCSDSLAHSGQRLGSAPARLVPSRLMPPTVTCALVPPSNRAVTASTTWLPTVRPKRVIHAFGIGSLFVMVPTA